MSVTNEILSSPQSIKSGDSLKRHVEEIKRKNQE